jgi:hypothetical protein
LTGWKTANNNGAITMAKEINRVGAIMDIINDFRSPTQKTTVTSCNRVLKACRDLGLTNEETIRMMAHAGYCRHDNNQPFPGFEGCKWPKP